MHHDYVSQRLKKIIDHRAPTVSTWKENIGMMGKWCSIVYDWDLCACQYISALQCL